MPNGQGTAKTLSRVRGTREHHFLVPSPLIAQTKTRYRHSSQSSKAAPAHPRPLANTSSSWHPRQPQCSILWTPAHTEPNASCSTKEPWHGAPQDPSSPHPPQIQPSCQFSPSATCSGTLLGNAHSRSRWSAKAIHIHNHTDDVLTDGHTFKTRRSNCLT